MCRQNQINKQKGRNKTTACSGNGRVHLQGKVQCECGFVHLRVCTYVCACVNMSGGLEKCVAEQQLRKLIRHKEGKI